MQIFFGAPSPFLTSLSQKSVKTVTPHPYKNNCWPKSGGPQILQKPKSHLKILGARSVK